MTPEATTEPWRAWVDTANDRVRAAGQWRAPRAFDAAGPEGTLTATGDRVVSFASNDYLGLSQHPAVVGAAHDALDRWGAGAGAARLIVGSRPVHHDLEDALAEWRGTEAAVVFPTGFAANLGVLSTLAGPGVRICSDALNHASIIDGCRLARANGADVRVFAHRDLDALDALLAEPGAERLVVVTDTVFSMDGDVADVDGLVALCDRHGALLVLDEAHAVLQDPPSVPSGGPVVVQVGTLSKTLGALGGFVAGPRSVVDLLVNRARSYIFTTASSPADTAAALAAVGVVTSPEGEARRDRLRTHVARLRPGHPSPVVAVLLGEEAAALDAAARLLDAGLLVPAIRPPTVAPGTSRLRVALSAAHTDDQLDRLLSALSDLPVATTAPGGPA
ncbi:aminotransferase class I/II-fold pyridoxal phosphate-dependent enzyme [Rhabdothermincola salaria]|uniref:aminotransferase class I/II-fold pyridoxal phosphate-dependent enzyme n=1 Tax=Rhabdothermincola salaria TaxID=2903142 RepID=UPI001E382F58|nr:8-amino-7-oxononanoate synthase [Rhabdothermincola salaria]